MVRVRENACYLEFIEFKGTNSIYAGGYGYNAVS
jgi:hypothetical protein